YHLGIIVLGLEYRGDVRELIGSAAGNDCQVGRNLTRLRLDEQVIILGDKGDTFDVAGADADEQLTCLELQVDLVTHIAPQPVHLVAVVDRGANATVGNTPQRDDFSPHRAGTKACDRDGDGHHQQSDHCADPTRVEALLPAGGAVSTSGSRPSSTILKP